MNHIKITGTHRSSETTATHERYKVTIIESDQSLREGFAFLVRNADQFSLIGSYESYEQAANQLIKHLPDIVIMGFELPGKNGIESSAKIKSAFSRVEIILVSDFLNRDLVMEALRVGISGFLQKSSNYERLISALNELVAGGAPLTSKVSRMLVNEFRTNLISPLTIREREVMNMLANGLTYTKIGDQLSISAETAKAHIRNIYRKLNVNSKSDAIEFALREHLVQRI